MAAQPAPKPKVQVGEAQIVAEQPEKAPKLNKTLSYPHLSTAATLQSHLISEGLDMHSTTHVLQFPSSGVDMEEVVKQPEGKQKA